MIDNPKSIIPEEVIQYLENNNIRYVFKLREMLTLTLLRGDIAHFILVGNYKMFTKEELKSIFYHEIGHIVNNSFLKRVIFMIVVSSLFIALNIIFLLMSRSIILKNFTTCEVYFIYECLIESFSLKSF